MRTKLLTLILLVLAGRPSHAVVLNNVVNASNWDKATSPATVYGGVSGFPPSGSPGTLYNSCVNADLKPCNTTRIYAGLPITFQFKSDAGTGIPGLYFVDGTTVARVGTTYGSPVGAGGDTSVTVLWSEICEKLNSSSPDVGVNCEIPPTATEPKGVGHFRLGFQPSTTDSTLNADVLNVDIAVGGYSSPATDSTISDCNTGAGAYGICLWEMFAGDEKAILSDPTPVSGTVGPIFAFNRVRVFYAASDFASPNYNLIKASTPTFQDLRIDNSDSNGVSLTPARVEGLQNEVTYVFKIAMVDLAGNVGYFTANSGGTDGQGDLLCASELRKQANSANGQSNCHLATPGTVVGALGKPLSCFIATAAYGSPLAPQVETFRQFRNQILLQYKWGVRFVEAYYEYGPRYAKIIARSEVLKTTARAALWPVLGFAWLALQIGAASASLLVLGFFALGTFLTRRLFARRRAARA